MVGLVIPPPDQVPTGMTRSQLGAVNLALRAKGAGPGVLNLGVGGDVDTSTPMGSMLFTVMAALAQMEHGRQQIKCRERRRNRVAPASVQD